MRKEYSLLALLLLCGIIGIVNGGPITANISGMVFHDLDANGIYEGEPGFSGPMIYVDYNNDAGFDAGEPYTSSDASGMYTLSNITPGSWNIRATLDINTHCSYPGEGISCFHHVTVLPGDSITGINFGYWRSVTLFGDVVEDVNANHQIDTDELSRGLGPWLVYVDRNRDGYWNGVDEPYFQGWSGTYFGITDIKPGTFDLRIILPEFYACSYPPTCAWNLTVSSGETVNDKDFAAHPPVLTVCGYSYQDLDGDGIIEEEPGIGGIPVDLWSTKTTCIQYNVSNPAECLIYAKVRDTLIASTLTEQGSGRYCLDDKVVRGTQYLLTENDSSLSSLNWNQSYPSIVNPYLGAGWPVFLISPTSPSEGWDFLNYRSPFQVTHCMNITHPGMYLLQNDILNHTGICSGSCSCINISASHVTVEGGDHTIDGVDASQSKGIFVNHQDNVTVSKVTVSGWGMGIDYVYSDQGRVIDNRIHHNRIGTRLWGKNTMAYRNNISDNGGLGIIIQSSTRGLISDNIIQNNREIGIEARASWLTQVLNNTIVDQPIGIQLTYSNDVEISNNTLENQSLQAITVDTSQFAQITSNSFHENGRSTSVRNSIAMFAFNTIHGDLDGVELINSNTSFVLENQIVGHPGNELGTGIWIETGRQNSIFKNTIVGFKQGINLTRTSSVVVQDNDLTADEVGLSLTSTNTSIIFNNILNCTDNVLLLGTYEGIRWNVTPTTDYPSIMGGCSRGGNYWANPEGSGFSETCPDTNYDGFCDERYTLASGQVDYYPVHEFLKGDLTGDGAITWGDVVKLAYMSWGLIERSPCADFSNPPNGTDWGDVVQLAYYYWGLVEEL